MLIVTVSLYVPACAACASVAATFTPCDESPLPVISVVAVALPKPAPVKLGVKYKVYGIGLLVEGLTAVSFPLSVPVVFAVPPAPALKADTLNDVLLVHCTVLRLPVEYTGAEVDGSIPRAMLPAMKFVHDALTVALIRTVWLIQSVGGAANAPPAMAIMIIVIAATKIFVFIVVPPCLPELLHW